MSTHTTGGPATRGRGVKFTLTQPTEGRYTREVVPTGTPSAALARALRQDGIPVVAGTVYYHLKGGSNGPR